MEHFTVLNITLLTICVALAMLSFRKAPDVVPPKNSEDYDRLFAAHKTLRSNYHNLTVSSDKLQVKAAQLRMAVSDKNDTIAAMSASMKNMAESMASMVH